MSALALAVVAPCSIAPWSHAEDDERDAIDWRPKAELNPQQQIDATYCSGRYVSPYEPDGSTVATKDSPLEATADRSRAQGDGSITLEGDVKARQGAQSLEAEKVVIDRNTGQAKVEGDVVLRDRDVRVAADKGEINNQRNTAELNEVNVVAYPGQLRAQASRFKKHRDNSIHLSHGSITTCPPGQEDWSIQADAIDIRDDNIWGVLKNPVVKFKGVPVFWLPFMTFPASDERLSGFLFPAVGFSDNGGLDVALPYYFNLAPNYDLLLSPRHINNRGTGLEGQFRHLSPLFESQIDFAGLSDDQGIDSRTERLLNDAGVSETDQANLFNDKDRWLLGIQQKGGFLAGGDQAWFSEIDFTRVSDRRYFDDINNTAIDVSEKTHLLRLGSVGYQTDNWRATLSARSYQTLEFNTPQPYQELPRLNVDGDYVWQGFSARLAHEYVQFDQDGLVDDNGNQIIRGERARLAYDFIRPYSAIWGYITPGLHIKHTAYELNDDNLIATAEASQNYTAFQGSVDSGLFFERQGRVSNWRYLQTFEPRLFYLYSNTDDQSALFNVTADGGNVDFDTTETTFSYNQLFRTSRFAGGDRIDDDHRVSLGLTSRIIDSNSGRELFSASLGQSFYLDNREVFADRFGGDDVGRSEIAGELGANIGKRLRWDLSVVYDPEQDLTNLGRTSLRYLDSSHRLINVGFNFQRKDNNASATTIAGNNTQQSDISMILPVNKRVNFIFRNLHDFTFDRELDTFSGLEYNSCCYRARFVWRRWISNDLSRLVADDDLNYKTGVFFDIQLKGLGSSAGRFYQLLSDTIPGYSTREQAVFPE